MFVASDVFPIDGRPARIIRSEGCSPPSFLSRSTKLVATPTVLPSRLNAASAIVMALVSARAKGCGPALFPRPLDPRFRHRDGFGRAARERVRPPFRFPRRCQLKQFLLGALD